MIKRIIDHIKLEYYYYKIRKLLAAVERENSKNVIS
jgi:hypothetical protein